MTHNVGTFGREVPIFWRVKKRKLIPLNLWYLPDNVRGITSQETLKLVTL